MKTVNIQEAKTHLSRLVEAVAGGETVVIAKAGTPVATLSKWEPAMRNRVGGGWKGKVTIAPDFDEPDPAIEKLFYEGDGGDSALRVAGRPGE